MTSPQKTSEHFLLSSSFALRDYGFATEATLLFAALKPIPRPIYGSSCLKLTDVVET